MIGAGGIALAIGVFGYSMGSPFALVYAILVIPFNWWVLMLDDDEQSPALGLRCTNWRFVMAPLVGATAIQLGFV